MVSREQIIATITAKKPEYEKWLNRDCWKEYDKSDKEGYFAWYFDEESGLRSIKSHIEINKPLKTVVDYIRNLENKKIYDTSLEDAKEIQRFDDEYSLQYFKYKGLSFLVSARDFYVAMEAKVSESEATFFGTSFTDASLGEVKSVVRADCHYAGFVLKKIDDNKTDVLYYTLGDMKLAQTVINMTLKKVAKQIVEIKNILEKK